MPKRLLLTTAVGLILSTAAFAQTSAPSKTAPNTPAAQQTDKNAKPMSRVEKWQADKQTEAAEKTLDKNGVPTPSTPPAASAQAPAAAQTPASSAAPATTAQSPTPTPAAKTAPTQAQTTPQPAQPTAAPAQAQTPSAAPAADRQAQQPANSPTPAANSNAAATTPAQTTISAGVSVTDPQRTRISESVARVKVQPLTKVNFSVSVGTVIPRDVRLHPVPTEVVEIVPQYRDYQFFTVREEIVIVEPSTMKIVTVLPRNGGATASTTTSTQTSSTTTTTRKTISDSDRAAIKKHAAQPRRERTTTVERDDPRSARADSRRQLRVGDRLPESVEMYDMPEPAYREAPALREYRYMQRGSRTYVIEPRGRTIVEEFD